MGYVDFLQIRNFARSVVMGDLSEGSDMGDLGEGSGIGDLGVESAVGEQYCD